MASEDGFASSSDRVARMETRTRRMEARSASSVDDSGKKKKHEAAKAELSIGLQQVSNSLAALDDKKVKSISSVTSVRVAADRRENVRRIVEEDKRQERLRRLQEEAYSSGKHNAAVDMKWAELMEEGMPHELLKEINKQKAACALIIASKDKLIREFRGELKAKDEAYVKSLKSQADDINALLSRMASQYKLMQASYEEELEAIERAYLLERSELLRRNKSDMESLFDKRRKVETQFMEAKQRREEQHISEIEKIRVEDAEKFNKLKIRLETDIQTLEQQLEEMRATYQLNTEKLEYNYRVLTERDHEHSATLTQQKRKESRLKDALAGYMSKYSEMDARYKGENSELTEEYRRITKQYKELQKKFHHFELADNKQYQAVWLMHEGEVAVAVSKALQADKIIHEQQLGWAWLPPKEDPLRPATVTKGDSAIVTETDRSPGDGPEKALEATMDAAVAGEVSTLEAERLSAKTRVKNMQVRHMLELLCAEAGFLIDPEIRKTLDGLSPDERAIQEADAVLKALNVDTEDEVGRLLAYFFSPISEEDELAIAKSLDVKSLGLKVRPDDVIKVVKRYSEERDSLEASASASKTTAAVEASAEQREKARLEEEMFWRKMSDVIGAKTTRVWSALETGLIKYNALLKGRAELLSDVTGLQTQNSELKKLLSQYLAAPVNDALKIPPTMVIQIERRG